MSFPSVISASVGQGGVNRPEDVRLVEDLLVGNHDYKLTYSYTRRTAPGDCDPILIQAILDFQTDSMPNPNGRVDPPAGLGLTDLKRLTWERLVRPPLEQLPQTLGRGYYSYAVGPHRQFGTPQTIKTLERVAGIFFFKMKYNEPAIPGNRPYREIGIGELSFAKGGPMPPHKEHRWGTEVDIRPLRKDGKRLPVKITDTQQYDREATRILVDSLRSHLNVATILFDDRKIKGVQWVGGHGNHLHVHMLD
jgi:hypothetical protein